MALINKLIQTQGANCIRKLLFVK